jgi:hypothetical protein
MKSESFLRRILATSIPKEGETEAQSKLSGARRMLAFNLRVFSSVSAFKLMSKEKGAFRVGPIEGMAATLSTKRTLASSGLFPTGFLPHAPNKKAPRRRV